MQIPPMVSEVFLAVRRIEVRETEKYDTANSRFSQFCKRAKKVTEIFQQDAPFFIVSAIILRY
jgi:hypothetical protein